MACTDYTGGTGDLEALNASAGAFRDFFLCGYQTQFPSGEVFALFILGSVAVANYYKTGSMVMPAILAVLIGGRLLSEVAPIGIEFTWLVLLFILVVGPILLLRRAGKL